MIRTEGSLTRSELEEHLTALVGFETVTGGEKDFTEAFQYIKDNLHPSAQVEMVGDPQAPVLLASNSETKTPDICFLVHVDVVPGRPDQFSLKIEGDVAYGRGVSDMKYSIVMGMALLRDLIDSDSNLSFQLAVTSDEERGGFKGAAFLANEYGLAPKLLIVPDGGDDFVLIDRSKAVSQLQVSATGESAHSSRPWGGQSALEPLVELAHQLLQRYAQNNTGQEWAPTLNIGILQSGKSITTVPAEGKMTLDFRYPGEFASDSFLNEVRELAAQISDRLSVVETAAGVPTLVDLTHQAIVLFRSILEESIGREMTVSGGLGSSDVRHFNNRGQGSPFIMTKPEGGDIHGEAEYINLESVMLYYQILLQFLREYEDLQSA
jgi:succinyl-diaminopimelate desuccinylase